MKPLIVLVLLPALLGVGSFFVFRAIRVASFAAVVGSMLAVCFCIRLLDPESTWSWLAALLVSPLVVSVAMITVLFCAGRARDRRRAA